MWGKVKNKAVIVALLILISSLTSISLSENITKKNIGNPEIPYQEGWPQETIGGIVSPPVIADLDMDGKMEIIVGSGYTGYDHSVYVFHHNGSYMDGWPRKVNDSLYGSPAIGDIDNDGDFEIIIGDNGKLYAWHHDGAYVDGWQKKIRHCTSSLTLYDLDNNGDLEISIGTTEKKPNQHDYAVVHIWHHNGTYYEGWPQNITQYEFSSIQYLSGAVGDIDNDGDAEIIFEALDAKSIFIDFTGDIGLKIAGLKKIMSVSAQAEIEVPAINEILLINDIFLLMECALVLQ